MKRLLLILLCVALLGSLFIPALGEAITARKIYVRVPSSWDTVYLWTNGETGEIFGPQPGTEMVPEDDFYCLNIPDELTEFTLFSSEEEASEPISTTPDHDLYVTVEADGTSQVNCIGFEEPALLTLAEKEYCLVGYINGKDYGFEKDYMNIGEYIFVDGTLTATFLSDSYIFVKTTDNNHWYLTQEYCTDTSAVFIEDSQQKMFVPGNVELTFTLEEIDDTRISLSYKPTGENVTIPTTAPTEPEPEATEPEEPVPTRTMTITPPDTWSDIHIYTWDPEEYGIFPGIPVEKVDGVCTVTIKNTVKNLVISGYTNEGRIQTGDILLVDNGKDVTINVMVNRAFTIAYNGDMAARKPAAANPLGILSSYRVAGSTSWLGQWDAKNDLGIMHEVVPGLYRKNYENVPPGKYELKITKDGTWNGAYGDAEGQNFFFNVDANSIVTIELVIKDGKAYIDAYGAGINLTSNSRTSSSSGSTDVTEPSETTPPASKPAETEPVTTIPDVTSSVATAPASSGPAATEPNATTQPNTTAPTEPVVADPNDGPDNALSNHPFGGMKLFLFGVIAACIYLVYLLIKRGSVTGEVTPDGKLLQRKQLSKTDVENAVKENMPAPSDKLDQSVMEAIHKAKQPPTES